MFVSYEYLGHDYYDPITNKYRWRFKIVDSEWEAVAVMVASTVGDSVAVGLAVIQEYSKRELPVAANLIRAFQWYSSKYGYSIEQIVDSNKQHNPQYKQYKEEADKLLVLL